jgi:intracellular septation protein
MNEQKINPMLKIILELGPIIMFFLVYGKIKDKTFEIAGIEYQGFIIATGLFIPVLLASILLLWLITGKMARMQIVTAILVVLFGGLTIWFNDDRFFKMKPTIIYFIFGGLLAFGLTRGKSYLEYVMEDMLPMEQKGWLILTTRVSVFFFALAITNEIVWRNMSTTSWVNFKTFGLTGALFLFFVGQSALLKKYTKNIDK